MFLDSKIFYVERAEKELPKDAEVGSIGRDSTDQNEKSKEFFETKVVF